MFLITYLMNDIYFVSHRILFMLEGDGKDHLILNTGWEYSPFSKTNFLYLLSMELMALIAEVYRASPNITIFILLHIAKY